MLYHNVLSFFIHDLTLVSTHAQRSDEQIFSSALLSADGLTILCAKKNVAPTNADKKAQLNVNTKQIVSSERIYYHTDQKLML